MQPQPLTSVDARPIHPSARGWLGFAQPLETRVREPLAALLADVGVVEAIYPAPREWADARRRWERYLELASPHTDVLAAAIVDGSGNMSDLRALALAEVGAGPVAEADLRAMLVPRVCHTLATLWAPHALKAFRACGAAFDQAADDAARDHAANAMCAAARLASPEVDQNIASWSVERLQLGLTVSPERAHLRRVAEAFGQPDRWTAVQELGAKLRAASHPTTTWPELPAYISCVNHNRVFTSWDPLDGPLPEHWQTRIDGWIGG